MTHQGLFLQRVFICFSVLFMTTSKLVESTTSAEQVSDSIPEAAQDRRTVPLSASSIHRTTEVLKPSQIRNRRSDLLAEKEQFIDDDNPGLDSAYMYSDQIIQNLLKTQSPKPLNYARSNFFLNLLKPRTTRYNAWDDHSLMHFGKRSLDDFNDADRILVKRSADVWSPNNVLHFGKKSENPMKNDDGAFEAGIEIPNSEAADKITSDEINLSSNDDPDSVDETVNKKSIDPWHSIMSFGKKSETSLDDSTLYTDKKDDPWHNKMSFGKRFENPWDHNTMHFGKRDDPWHNMMSFGKKSDPWHSMMSFGKKLDPWHSMMSFGKRFVNPWDHNTLHFGKRDEPWHNMMSFGKKSDPWHSMMSFGKKSDNPWDHNTLHFGKREDPWHNMMSFGKRSQNYDLTDLEKRDDPWHNMMSFGKRYDNLENNTVSANKRDEPWHNMMSFGKRSDNDFGEHFTLHFGKRDEPWHSMMSFGKKSDLAFDHNTLHFGKREDPWHNMMSFGKKSDGLWDHNTLHFGKKDEPWHNMMSFGKKSDNPWGEHSTLHFGKREDPWHNMMSFGKRPDGLAEDDFIEDFGYNSNPWEDYNAMEFNKKYDPWEHNALHFGKKSNVSSGSILSTQSIDNLKHIQKRSADMWNDHHTMHFGKKSDPWESHNTMHFGKKSDPWESYNTMHFGKKSEPWESHNTMHFGKKSELEDFENSMNVDKRFDWEHSNLHFGKKSEPWEHHNTMHFGKKSDPWDYHNTMHFGKRNPWEYHNTMHFGKKSDPWDYHNTMHFGKKREPWDYHNTMHFGKRSDPNLQTGDTHSQNNIEIKKDNENKESNLNKNYNSNEALENGTEDNESKEDIKKRSSKALKSTSDTVKYNINDDNNKEISNSEVNKELNDNQKLADQSRIIKRSLKNEESINQKNAMIGNAKQEFGYGLSVVTNEEQGFEPSTSALSDKKDPKLKELQVNNTKSRIHKRSIESGFNTNNKKSSENLYPNTETFEEYSKDDFPETVLHFGKRSTGDSEDNKKYFDAPWFDPSEAKRFDDFWDNHNTLHFGKKSEPWESHSTLHFGKKSNPWEHQSTMHFGKRDPWDYHNTLHFGKKFDPWEGHAKMHFGKRTGDWDHNVMHFGKRDELKTDDDENTDAEDVLTSLLDPIKLKHLQQEIEEIDSEENKDILEDLQNLEMTLKSYLKDENMPMEEKLFLLKSYLRRILKTILSRQMPEDKLLPYSGKTLDGEVNNNEITEDRKGSLDSLEAFPPRTLINDFNYEGVLPTESEDFDEGEYDEHSKLIDYLKGYKNFFKSKRSYLGKPEFKRYFVPFQGPKSIVYPHAWFASQIRRSAIPRTPDYARTMEMRMAEKKEDPFNSYMHFGRR